MNTRTHNEGKTKGLGTRSFFSGSAAGRYGRSVNRRDEVLERKAAIRAAARRSRARSIALVGSVARGDDTDRSDFDFLVDFEDDADLFDVAGLQVDLEDLLGQPVDIVDSAAVRESHIAMFEDAIPL